MNAHEPPAAHFTAPILNRRLISLIVYDFIDKQGTTIHNVIVFIVFLQFLAWFWIQFYFTAKIRFSFDIYVYVWSLDSFN